MKPFRFSLQALRTVRQRQEQVAMEQYSLAIQAQREASAALQSALREQELAWNQRQDHLRRGAPAIQVMQLQAYCQAAERHCHACQDILRKAEENTTDKWRQYTEARKRREVVDKFYERQRWLYERECAREEQKVLDELGLRRGTSALQEAMENLWN